MTSSASATDRSKKSILAVDDENAILDIIKQSLQRQQFKVCTFTDPFKALACLSGSKSAKRAVYKICQDAVRTRK
jgi:DNA-binding NtrC family response regulator